MASSGEVWRPGLLEGDSLEPEAIDDDTKRQRFECCKDPKEKLEIRRRRRWNQGVEDLRRFGPLGWWWGRLKWLEVRWVWWWIGGERDDKRNWRSKWPLRERELTLRWLTRKFVDEIICRELFLYPRRLYGSSCPGLIWMDWALVGNLSWAILPTQALTDERRRTRRVARRKLHNAGVVWV